MIKMPISKESHTAERKKSLFNCSIRTAFNDLQDMIDKKILKRKGVGKYTYYEMV